MLIEIKVPVLAESIADARVLDWHKQPGDRIGRGEHLTDLETDKVTLEITAPEAGMLKEIYKKAGETALSQEVLAVIDTARQAEQHANKEISPPKPASKRVNEEAPPTEDVAPLSPAVRRLVTEHALDPKTIPARGKNGRITKQDVLTYLETKDSGPVPPPAQRKDTSADPDAGQRPTKRVAMSRLRLRVAERLLAAQRENAILTTFNEINMQPVMALRERYRSAFELRHGARLGFMGFFCKAAVSALKKFPIVNASIDGSYIEYHDYYDLGIAVSSPRGLVVPVLRDIDRMGFAQIEIAVKEFGDKARDAKLAIDELSGGTFTITNGGVFGSLLSTPIINPPQSAILGMHRIQERPVAEEGQVVIRPMMYVALSYDHRIIDGREAVQFLVTIKQ
ncbi:MAG: 2-oxoglutarate dehydrogenase complex dihydrolipoyllysine-residue succinyltransferase, partial [Gammaproteobacteria bacterium]